jgi:uncharacterized protein YggU (UPF0235/DUF167 family)
MRKFEIKDAVGGSALTVRVVTRATRNEIVGMQDDGALKVRLKVSPPEDDVNAALTSFLASVLKIDASQIEIVAGVNSREKLVSIEEISPAMLEERLSAELE